MKKVDYSGLRFGRLLVLEMVRAPGKDARANCLCDCGTEKLVTVYNLKSGNTKSCGCLAREMSKERFQLPTKPRGPGASHRKHGLSGSPTYASWCDAKKRCYSPANKRYGAYGGRGIGMCDAWRKSFEAFLNDMGERPIGRTLERKNVHQGYEPGNCIWATPAQQAQNMRTNVATWAIVRAMRERRAAGATYPQLASEFCMSYNNVRLICLGETWKEHGDAH